MSLTREFDLPKPPTPPPNRMIRESAGEVTDLCKECGSSMNRRKYWLFGNWDGCIQPKCGNYYGNK